MQSAWGSCVSYSVQYLHWILLDSLGRHFLSPQGTGWSHIPWLSFPTLPHFSVYSLLSLPLQQSFCRAQVPTHRMPICHCHWYLTTYSLQAFSICPWWFTAPEHLRRLHDSFPCDSLKVMKSQHPKKHRRRIFPLIVRWFQHWPSSFLSHRH